MAISAAPRSSIGTSARTRNINTCESVSTTVPFTKGHHRAQIATFSDDDVILEIPMEFKLRMHKHVMVQAGDGPDFDETDIGNETIHNRNDYTWWR